MAAMGPACVNGWASSLAFAQPFVITTSRAVRNQSASLGEVVIARHALVVVGSVHRTADGAGLLFNSLSLLGGGVFSRGLFS